MLFSCCRVTALTSRVVLSPLPLPPAKTEANKTHQPTRELFFPNVSSGTYQSGGSVAARRDQTDGRLHFRLHHSGPGLQEEGQRSVERTEAAVGSTSPTATADQSSSGAPCGGAATGGGQRVTKTQPQSPELTKPLLFFCPVFRLMVHVFYPRLKVHGDQSSSRGQRLPGRFPLNNGLSPLFVVLC